MNKVVLLSMGLTITLLIFSVIYFTPFFSKKKIRHGRFDLLQFINLFFSPLLIIPMLYFLREIILQNPEAGYLIIPKYAKELSFLLILYLMILGHGIHSLSVVLAKNMKGLTKHKVWHINEYFHNRFSHLLITVSAILIVFSFSIMEINHPNPVLLTREEIAIVVVGGIAAGIVTGMAAIEGSIPNSMLALNYVLGVIVPFIFIKFNLQYRHFPFTTFTETMLIFSVMTIILYGKRNKGYPEIVPHYFFDD